MRSTLAGSLTDSVFGSSLAVSAGASEHLVGRDRAAGSAGGRRPRSFAHVVHSALRPPRRPPRPGQCRRLAPAGSSDCAIAGGPDVTGPAMRAAEPASRLASTTRAGPQSKLARVGWVEEGRGLERHQGHVAEAGHHLRTGRPPASPPRSPARLVRTQATSTVEIGRRVRDVRSSAGPHVEPTKPSLAAEQRHALHDLGAEHLDRLPPHPPARGRRSPPGRRPGEAPSSTSATSRSAARSSSS